MALQRNLKALGTFGYQTMTRAQPGLHPVHAAHARITRATNLEKYPRFARLRGACWHEPHVEELR